MTQEKRKEKHHELTGPVPSPTVFTPPAMAVTIDSDVWERMVAYTLAPECETERLHRLVYHALKTVATGTRSRLSTGMFCLPADGSATSPLWHQLRLEFRGETLHVAF
ncbi:hypothetical protein RX799_24770 [Klebsiella oxytoca]|uniref:hypothetical protein n=1 Tax=Klebsiella oxytoca TaxID=571 RepID=UPI003850A821